MTPAQILIAINSGTYVTADAYVERVGTIVCKVLNSAGELMESKRFDVFDNPNYASDAKLYLINAAAYYEAKGIHCIINPIIK